MACCAMSVCSELDRAKYFHHSPCLSPHNILTPAHTQPPILTFVQQPQPLPASPQAASLHGMFHSGVPGPAAAAGTPGGTAPQQEWAVGAGVCLIECELCEGGAQEGEEQGVLVHVGGVCGCVREVGRKRRGQECERVRQCESVTGVKRPKRHARRHMHLADPLPPTHTHIPTHPPGTCVRELGLSQCAACTRPRLSRLSPAAGSVQGLASACWQSQAHPPRCRHQLREECVESKGVGGEEAREGMSCVIGISVEAHGDRVLVGRNGAPLTAPLRINPYPTKHNPYTALTLCLPAFNP